MSFLRVYIAHGLDMGLRRQKNEDAVGYHHPDIWEQYQRYGVLLVVADGVGGLSDGVLASDAAVRGLIHDYYQATPDNLERTLETTLQRLNQDIHARYQSSATTLVSAVIRGEELIIAHVGDSRAYLYSRNLLRQLTQDHVHPVTQPDGRIKQKLTQALGYKQAVAPDIQKQLVVPGDRIILMTDGATRYLNEAYLSTLCRQHHTPQQLTQAIIKYANDSGGIDNIGVIVVDVAEPLENANELSEHLLVMTAKPNKDSSSDPNPTQQPVPIRSNIEPTKKRTPLFFLVAFGLILIIAGIVYSQIIQPNIEATLGADTQTHLTDTTDFGAEMSEETVNPQTLTTGAFIRFSGSAATRVRIQDDVLAFALEPDHTYQISEVYQTNTGVIWYRLFDERNENYGWIAEDNLPDYRFMP
jgi:serine/threonine protein phosphatase PrpC